MTPAKKSTTTPKPASTGRPTNGTPRPDVPATLGVLDMDLHNLELDWVRQPHYTEEWLGHLADANYDIDDLKLQIEVAKENLKKVDAQLDTGFRQEHPDWKERGYESAVLLAEDHDVAKKVVFNLQQQLNHAVHKAGRLDAMTHALVDKKKGLEKNVDMMLAGLWAPCRQPKGEINREALAARQKQALYDRGKPRNRGGEDGS